MTLRVTVDVFSGRPNPTVDLDGPEADRLEELLRDLGQFERLDLPEEAVARLGYSGLVVERYDERQDMSGVEPVRIAGGVIITADGAFDTGDTTFEEFVCGSDGPVRFPDLTERLIPWIRDLRDWLLRPWPPIKWPFEDTCSCAPLYEPQWWNQQAYRPHNNCYNYGTNYRTNTFAQPGLKAGAMYQNVTGPEVLAGAVADQLIDSPGADNECPDEGHLVALVIDPGWDFHWYRKGRNGLWTHKPGGTPVTNLDNSGNLIDDPRTADRGGYTEFTTFMTVMHGHIAVE